jgi:hypothetical protein
VPIASSLSGTTKGALDPDGASHEINISAFEAEDPSVTKLAPRTRRQNGPGGKTPHR